MDETRESLGYPADSGFNPFAGSQVADLEARTPEEDFRLLRPIALEGRSSLETMVRAVWKTYGSVHSVRFWLWVLGGSTVAAYLFHVYGAWWWPAILLGLVAALLYVGIIVPCRLARHVQRFSPDFELPCRGRVTDESIVLQQQTREGEWRDTFSDEPVIDWSNLRLAGDGEDYLLFVRRKENQHWLLLLPRALFTSDRDWQDMLEFADRRLRKPIVAPRCAKCRQRLARSELRPMPWGLRLLVGQPFSSFGFVLGVPPAQYCDSCWNSVYMRQIAFLIGVVVVLLLLVATIAYLAFA